MLLIIEILLTVSAWKKGWRAKALLPLGIGVFVAFVAGIIIGVNHGNPDNLNFPFIILDLLVVFVLGAMCNRTPEVKKGWAEKMEVDVSYGVEKHELIA